MSYFRKKIIGVENMEFPGVRKVKYEDFIFFLSSQKKREAMSVLLIIRTLRHVRLDEPKTLYT